MKYNFRVVCSVGASFLSKEQRDEIVLQAVTDAEKLNLSDDAAIFSFGTDLKVVVRWSKREVHIMTDQEARKGWLPSPSDN